MEWHRGIRRTRIDFNEPTIIGSTNGIGNSKANNNGSVAITNKKVNTESFSNLAQLAAWGLPAVQTVAVLVARVVDADELLGKFKFPVLGFYVLDWVVLFVSRWKGLLTGRINIKKAYAKDGHAQNKKIQWVVCLFLMCCKNTRHLKSICI